MRVQVPLSPKKPTWLPNYLSYPILSLQKFFFSYHKSCGIYIWYAYKRTSLSKESPFEWFTVHIIIRTETYKVFFFEDPRNSRSWIILCFVIQYPFVFRLFIFNWHRPSHLVKWGWCIGNSRDSSAGRAEDWKSSCHQFKSGSWHMINLSEYLFYKFIDV